MNTLPAAALAGALTFAQPLAAEATPTGFEDRIAIGDLITGIGLHADQREWNRLERAFADEVTTDYVSLFGGQPTV